MPDLVLASTSRYRRELLARLGLPFRAVPPACDEESLKVPGLAPIALATMLARAKAESLRAAEPGAVIIGSDQIAALGDVVLGKPGTVDRAEAQLAMLAGQTHVLVTAVAVAHPGGLLEHVDVTRLTMRALPPDRIARYVAADMPTDCAGSYKLEARGITLFSRIESEDHSAITGLPLIALCTMLASLGFPVP
ncbi:Septum formation protein Maf [Minicystis rosea]|nr:Septum formation protein Maf [Minicystis rosea]